MILEKMEIAYMNSMFSIALFSEEIEVDDTFRNMQKNILYAGMSNCESITFDFCRREMDCLDQVTKIAMKSQRKKWVEHYASIRKKVEEELGERGMVRVDNATSTTSNT